MEFNFILYFILYYLFKIYIYDSLKIYRQFQLYTQLIVNYMLERRLKLKVQKLKVSNNTLKQIKQ